MRRYTRRRPGAKSRTFILIPTATLNMKEPMDHCATTEMRAGLDNRNVCDSYPSVKKEKDSEIGKSHSDAVIEEAKHKNRVYPPRGTKQNSHPWWTNPVSNLPMRVTTTQLILHSLTWSCREYPSG